MKYNWTLLGVAASLVAGCLEGTNLSLEEAPDGAQSLAVGGHHYDEYILRETRTTGHELDYEFDEDDDDEPFKATLVPAKGPRRSESVIDPAIRAPDAFNRELELVVTHTRSSTGDGSDYDQEFSDYFRGTAYSQRTARTVYDDTHSTMTYAVNDDEQIWERDVRSYHRPSTASDFGFASLAGRVLHVGETIPFAREYPPGDPVFRSYVNYTVLRQGTWNDERAFLVGVDYGFSGLKNSNETLTLTAPETVPATEPLPKATRLQWYTHGSPVPVKQVIQTPFQFGSKLYWRNSTTEVVEHHASGSRIAWGTGTPLGDPYTKPHSGPKVSARDYVARGDSGPLTYVSAAAWANLVGDLTLVEFQRHRLEHPEAWPFAALYVPDPANASYTWTFAVGDSGASSIIVSSRLQFLSPPGATIVQNRVQHPPGSSGFQGLSFRADSTVELYAIGDALDSFSGWLGEDGEPAILVRLQGIPDFWGGSFRSRAVLDLFDSSSARSYDENMFATMPARSITVDLEDGGVRVLNWTLAKLVPYDFPWFPLGINPPFAAGFGPLSAIGGDGFPPMLRPPQGLAR